jgi:integrase
MNIFELQKDPLIIEWFSITEVEPNTKKSFLQGMKYYTDFVKKTPAELISEAEGEIESGILMRKRRIKTYILTFREYLKGLDYAPKTIATHIASVKSFYRSFDIDLPMFNNKKQFRAQATEENGVRLEKEQIQEILKQASLRNRAIILDAASSGLAQADLLNLRVEDFKKGYDEKTLITTLHLRRQKTKNDFITFLSPEATIATRDYLDYRNRKPKPDYSPLMVAYEKRRVRSDKDYLFCEEHVPDRYLQTKDEKDRRLDAGGLMEMFRDLARKTGLDTERGKWQFVRSHNLRKFFNSQLLNNGAEFFFVEYLMGHKVGGTQEAYFKADPEKLKERYARYVPFLSLTDTEVHVIESEEYTMLKADYEELKSQIQTISEALNIKQTQDGKITFEAKIKQLPDEHPISKEGKEFAVITDKDLAEKVIEKGLSFRQSRNGKKELDKSE